jgi:hypothetical protein
VGNTPKLELGWAILRDTVGEAPAPVAEEEAVLGVVYTARADIGALLGGGGSTARAGCTAEVPREPSGSDAPTAQAELSRLGLAAGPSTVVVFVVAAAVASVTVSADSVLSTVSVPAASFCVPVSFSAAWATATACAAAVEAR